VAGKRIIQVPALEKAAAGRKPPLSWAVEAGGLVFVSGIPPIDPDRGGFLQGTIEQQTERVMENLKLVLAAAGTSLENVVKVTIYAVNSANFARINAVYARYFDRDPPARTFVTVASWPLEFDVEIECVALAG
jgi:2-iminobutanoate/2-iminopropanoate deaminase